MEFKNYKIEMKIDEQNDRFSGKETINLKASDEEIVLNSVDLEVGMVTVNGKDAEYVLSEERQELALKGKVNGDAEVYIEFNGHIKDILMGLYKSSTTSGKLYTTQFESSGARRAFPCLDNPGYKAEFELTLIIGKEFDAISNMPVRSEAVSGETKTVVFEKTPMMSTYLLYIGVGKFEERSEKFRNMEIILAAPRGHLGEVELPFQFARESVENYEKYFDIKYALPKMHLISVPDFGSGAMENWGAITFREVLLNVSKSTSALIKRTIAEVISHEIAHQWFGNLVTMKWWNDLWLNESFATFMSFKTVDKYHRDWDLWGYFLLTETSGAMRADSLNGSHPIDVTVNHPDDVAQIFDEISYGKGASILRMIESFVGEDNFRDGIRKYLKEHKFGNAVGSDLWSSIARVSNQPVEEIMGAWIKKQGYPVITATKSGSSIHLEQKRFLLSGEESDEIWPVPLTVRTEDGVKSVLFNDRSMDIDSHGFIKLNADQTGFYRVDYKGELFDLVSGNSSKFSDLDKLGLANDLFAFLNAGKLSIGEYLKRTDSFVPDESPLLAESVSTQLMTLNLILPENSRLKELSRKFFSTHLDRLGEKKDGEGARISILRGNLAAAFSTVDRDYASRLSDRFEKYEDADPDMRSAIAIGFAVSRNDLDTLASKLKDASSDEDRIKIILAMGWLTGEENYSGVQSLIDENVIRKQDMIRFYTEAAMNPAGRKFILGNYGKIADEMTKYFVGTGYAGMVIESTLPYLGLFDYDAARKAAEDVKMPESAKGVEKGLEQLEIFTRLKQSS